jgi:hypothetical protein
MGITNTSAATNNSKASGTPRIPRLEASAIAAIREEYTPRADNPGTEQPRTSTSVQAVTVSCVFARRCDRAPPRVDRGTTALQVGSPGAYGSAERRRTVLSQFADTYPRVVVTLDMRRLMTDTSLIAVFCALRAAVDTWPPDAW